MATPCVERVIVAFGVELRGLIPQLGGHVVPAHIPFAPGTIDRGEERREVESGESLHVAHVRRPSCRLDVLREPVDDALPVLSIAAPRSLQHPATR